MGLFRLPPVLFLQLRIRNVPAKSRKSRSKLFNLKKFVVLLKRACLKSVRSKRFVTLVHCKGALFGDLNDRSSSISGKPSWFDGDTDWSCPLEARARYFVRLLNYNNDCENL
jgi:hypothetical protein